MASEFVNPKNIMISSNNLSSIIKAIFNSLSFFILMLLCLHLKSNHLLIKISIILYYSLLSIFIINKEYTRAICNDLDSFIYFFFNYSFTNFCTSSLSFQDKAYIFSILSTNLFY